MSPGKRDRQVSRFRFARAAPHDHGRAQLSGQTGGQSRGGPRGRHDKQRSPAAAKTEGGSPDHEPELWRPFCGSML